MKILLTYFSYSGHTEKLANLFNTALAIEHEVRVQRLIPQTPIKNFLKQCYAARKKQRAELSGDITYDVSGYDALVIEMPVWAFNPVPAMNTFLDKLVNANNKKVAVVLSSGGGMLIKKCFANIEELLQKQGVVNIHKFNAFDSEYKQLDKLSAKVSEFVKNFI